LGLVDRKQRDEPLAGLLGIRRAADQRDDLVERVQRFHVAALDVRVGLGLGQPEGSAPNYHLDLVIDPARDEAIDRQRARHAVHDRQHVGAEVLLELRVLVQIVQHNLRDGITLEHDHQALASTARGLVADVGDASEFALLDEVSDLDRQVVGVDLVRQFSDDEADAALQLLDADDRAHRN
jgi:hypothetical protein